MDGGASRPPFMRPQSNQKRTFSTMAASHRHEASPVRDDHYENEHAARRSRFEAELRPARIRFPGDGLDFRRPVMSTSAVATPGPAEWIHDDDVNERMNAPAVIDLTDDDALQRPRGLSRQNTLAASHSGSARERRHLSPQRTVIDLESSGEERDEGVGYDTSNLPGASYLALPGRRVPSQHAGLRSPAHRRSPSANMDEIQFIEQRQRVLPRQTSTSLPNTPRPQRTVTPYPARQNDTIDLTEDDDEVVHLNTRQRDGVNLARPEATAGVGTRSMADRGVQHVGEMINLLREGGAQLGGRLYQRVQDFAGPGMFAEFEPPAPPAAARRNGPPLIPRQHHHAHHHHHRAHHPIHRHGPNAAVRAVAQALGVQNDMAGLMDYHLTGFGMHTGRANARPPTPKYEPPPPAADGFTRSPKEFEIVVCPNCGDELAMGDNDTKMEVWVVKACGHAYCGECAHNRIRTANKKGKKGKAPSLENQRLPEPFKQCVVPGCGKPAGRTSMIHVYLGS